MKKESNVKEYDQHLQNMSVELVDLVEKYQHLVPPYEVVNILVSNGVDISLSCAPNVLVGMKTVMACIEIGISNYHEKNQ